MRLLRTLALAAPFMFGAVAAQACTLPANANAFANDIAANMNAQRQQNGLPPLTYNRRLGQAAAGHACDMQRNGFFAHQGSDGSTAHRRIQRAGVRACQSAENLAYGYATGARVVQEWMISPGHRRNMLTVGVNEFGIGLADAPGGPYAVLVFSRDC